LIRNRVAFGILLGSLFGIADLIYTLLDPLVDDTPEALLIFYGPMFALWGLAGFLACRRTGRFVEALKTGLIVSAVTIAVFHLAATLRVNLFLDTIRHRADWRNLMSAYESSGVLSLREFVNYSYAKQLLAKLLVGTTIGLIVASIGGGASKLFHRRVV
jgi:hypothetical protein